MNVSLQMFKLSDDLYIIWCAILCWSRIYYYYIIWTFSHWEIHVFSKNYIPHTAARISCPSNAIQCNIKRTSTGHPQGWPTATKFSMVRPFQVGMASPEGCSRLGCELTDWRWCSATHVAWLSEATAGCRIGICMAPEFCRLRVPRSQLFRS
jgi:hypothetical protein